MSYWKFGRCWNEETYLAWQKWMIALFTGISTVEGCVSFSAEPGFRAKYANVRGASHIISKSYCAFAGKYGPASTKSVFIQWFIPTQMSTRTWEKQMGEGSQIEILSPNKPTETWVKNIWKITKDLHRPSHRGWPSKNSLCGLQKSLQPAIEDMSFVHNGPDSLMGKTKREECSKIKKLWLKSNFQRLKEKYGNMAIGKLLIFFKFSFLIYKILNINSAYHSRFLQRLREMIPLKTLCSWHSISIQYLLAGSVVTFLCVVTSGPLSYLKVSIHMLSKYLLREPTGGQNSAYNQEPRWSQNKANPQEPPGLTRKTDTLNRQLQSMWESQ